MSQEPTIIFEYWVDPYDTDHREYEEKEEDYELDEELEEGELDFSMLGTPKFNKPQKIVLTQFGFLSQKSLASKHFKFWICHANFKITTDYYKIIANVNGVESLEAMTPYRFKIAIAKLFEDGDVMRDIKDVMLQHHKKRQLYVNKKKS